MGQEQRHATHSEGTCGILGSRTDTTKETKEMETKPTRERSSALKRQSTFISFEVMM